MTKPAVMQATYVDLRKTDAELREHIEKHSMPIPFSGCWIWMRSTHWKGYGYTGLSCGTAIAHRCSYEVYRGPIPAGMLVCHSCDIPSCVNPDHLFLGTPQDNMDDMKRKGRTTAVLTQEQVKLIRASKERGRRLAERLGVSEATISLIRHRRIWTHVP